MGQIVLYAINALESSGTSTVLLLVLVIFAVVTLGSRTLSAMAARALAAHHRGLVAYHNSRRRQSVKGAAATSPRKGSASLAAAQ